PSSRAPRGAHGERPGVPGAVSSAAPEGDLDQPSELREADAVLRPDERRSGPRGAEAPACARGLLPQAPGPAGSALRHVRRCDPLAAAARQTPEILPDGDV